MKLSTVIEEKWLWDGQRYKIEIGPYSAYVYRECTQHKGFLYFEGAEIAHVRYPQEVRLLQQIIADMEKVIEDHHGL